MCLPFLPCSSCHTLSLLQDNPLFFFFLFFPLEIFTVVILFHASLCAKPVLSFSLGVPAGVSRLIPAQLNFIKEGLHLQNSQIMCLKHTQS